MAALTRMAGRLAIALLLVLLAAGSAFAAAATLPGLAASALAQETAEPSETATAEPSAEPSESPSADPTAEPPASPEAAESPAATGAPRATESPEATDAAEAREPGEADGDDTAPSLANLERIVAKLAAAGITTTTGELAELATTVGVGGAVRVLLFADAAGSTPAEIVALFETGKGWGVIAKELELGTNPGIGSVMGNGKGHDKAAKAAEKAERAQQRAERAAARAERKAGAGN